MELDTGLEKGKQTKDGKDGRGIHFQIIIAAEYDGIKNTMAQNKSAITKYSSHSHKSFITTHVLIMQCYEIGGTSEYLK